MPFETHAIVEIMGHVRIAGKVSEQVIAGAAMLRVDVPKTSKREPFTKFYGANAIYSITPTDEETANRAAEHFDETPVQPYILRLPESSVLAGKVAASDYRIDDYYNSEYDDEFDDADDDYPHDDDEDAADEAYFSSDPTDNPEYEATVEAARAAEDATVKIAPALVARDAVIGDKIRDWHNGRETIITRIDGRDIYTEASSDKPIHFLDFQNEDGNFLAWAGDRYVYTDIPF